MEGNSLGYQAAYGSTGDASVLEGFDEQHNFLMTLSEEERGKMLCELEDKRDPDDIEQLAQLLNYPDLRKAAYKERTRQALATMDPSAFVAMFKGQPAEEQAWMREIPEVVQELEYYKWRTGPKPSWRPPPKAPPSVQKQRLAELIAAKIKTASDKAAAEPTSGGLTKSDTSQ
jgi:hypothetical protein